MPKLLSLSVPVAALALVVPIAAASASPVLEFDFSNASVGDTTVAPSFSTAPVTSATFDTGGTNGVQSGVPIPGSYSVTRQFGTNIPSMTFTTSAALYGASLSFFTFQNHNFSYDTTYSVDVNLTPLSGSASVLGSFQTGPNQTTTETPSFVLPTLGAGTYTISWSVVPGSLGSGHTNTGSDYFALTDVIVGVPEPGSMTLLCGGLVGLVLARRRGTSTKGQPA